jgi:hypothetical protein
MMGKMKEEFPNFLKKCAEFKEVPLEDLSLQDWVELICADCQFYHAEEEERLECAAFKILKKLISQGALTFEEAKRSLEE